MEKGIMGLTYRDSGVDIDAGNELVRRIGPLAAMTKRPGVLGSLGGFGGLFGLKETGYVDPVLVSGTDGVGTKLKLAFAMNQHDSVGIDLVAMCVNDVLTASAEPLFFLDYFATGQLDPEVGQQVVAGIAEGCKQAGCALLGGETAEMPGMYAPGEYDLAGFCVAAVERAYLEQTRPVVSGDLLIGLPSSGLHSNGFSLARRVLLETMNLALDQPFQGDNSLGDVLLTPTEIYVRPILRTLEQHRESIKAMAHITGGGLIENIPRVLPEGLSMHLDEQSWTVPEVFQLIQSAGVDETEMLRTFNMGIGYVLVVSAQEAPKVMGTLEAEGQAACVIGHLGVDG
jgi:phosphoribosylformylglycinamidine cyclo-ligase